MYSVWNYIFALFRQLGYGDTVDRGGCNPDAISTLPAVDLGKDFNIAQIAVMHHHACALSTEDELKCWGQQNVSVQ